jgi:hypothetical protein
MAASIPIRLADIEEQIDHVEAQLGNDSGASPALKAVFEELHRKTRDARDHLKGADERTIRDHVIEVEEAADCAKRAAQADETVSDASRSAVLKVHDALCALKGDLGD